MKPQMEMLEGREALTRFEDTMRSLFSKRKADVIQQKPKTKTLGRPKKQVKPQG